jgi:hypothetical protein
VYALELELSEYVKWLRVKRVSALNVAYMRESDACLESSACCEALS